MIGAMMKGEEDLLTLQVIGDGPVGGMTVTADSHGYVKGYANAPQVILPASAQGKLDVGRAVGSGSYRGLGRGEFPGANVGNAFGRTFYADSRYHGDKVSLRMLQTEGGKGGCQHRKERY